MNLLKNTKSAALHASLIHLLISALVISVIAGFIFFLWFPYPYFELSGGGKLFLILIIVDVICGPILTLVIFNPKKSKKELTLDLSFIAFIQCVALSYGVYILSQARPVYIAFETDRFRVVSEAEIYKKQMKPGVNNLHSLSWRGPKIIGIRSPVDGNEVLQSLELSLNGIDPSMRPDWWQPYEKSKLNVLKIAHDLDLLKNKQKNNINLIDDAIKKTKINEKIIKWLPVTSGYTREWVALIRVDTAEIIAFIPIDGF